VELTYNNKPVMPTKTAMDELSDNNLDLYKAIEILETGFPIRKRQENVIEKGIRKGNKIINVVAVDMGNYYKLIHAGKFTLTKKFKKLIGEKNEL
jgi:hypothetical protein